MRQKERGTKIETVRGTVIKTTDREKDMEKIYKFIDTEREGQGE